MILMATSVQGPVILNGMTHRVGPKGQVVIPKDIRDRLGISPGSQVVFSEASGGVLVRRGVGGVGVYTRGVYGGGIVCGAIEFIYPFEFDSAVLGVGPTSI